VVVIFDHHNWLTGEVSGSPMAHRLSPDIRTPIEARGHAATLAQGH
jgi:hypothetical protein